MLYAQLGQQPLARTTETSLEPNPGTLSCLSARPHDLATATAAQPEVACVRQSIVPFVSSKRGGGAIPGFAIPGYRRSNVFVAVSSKALVGLAGGVISSDEK